MTDLTLGSTPKLAGDVTTLNWILPGHDRSTEGNLGYHPGRLAQGWWLALPVESLRPDDFQFSGTTLRSGGREGKPAETKEADERRTRVHHTILKTRGFDGYRDLQEAVLADIPATGPRRLAKVLPTIRHDADMPPKHQYPMGGGGLQWTLVRPVRTLIALRVEADGTARTLEFELRLPGSYEDRARLRRYLEQATLLPGAAG